MTPDERVRYIRRDPTEGDADDREAASPPSDAAEPEMIRVEIEQTRVEMTETIDAIQQKLNPEVLLEQAKDAAMEAAEHAAHQAAEHAKDAVREMTGQAQEAVREATIGKVEDMVQSAGDTASEARRTIVDLIRRNPMPAALAGIGLGWLYMNSRSSSSPSRPAGGSHGGATGAYGGRAPVAYPGQRDVYIDGRSSSPGDGGHGMVGGAVDRVQETASSLASQAQETAGQVAGQAQGAARAAGDTAGDIGSALLETIRQNPVPAALAGLSLGWLYMNRASSPAPTPSFRSTGGYRPADQGRSGGAGFIDQAQETAGQVVGQAQETASHVVGQAQEAAGQAVDRMQETAGRLAGQTQEKVGDLAGGAQSQAMRARYNLQEMFQDNPLVLGGLALALGAAAAIPVPQTPQEDRFLGEARDTFVDKAQEVAQDTLQKVQHVASEVQHTAEREAQDQGLAR